MTTRIARAALLAATVLTGCGTDASPELVVRDATMGGGSPSLLGASAASVYWSVAGGGGKLVAGSSLTALPADGQELVMATGPMVQAGDHVVAVSGKNIVRAGVDSPASRVMTGTTVDVLAETPEAMPRLVWTVADKLFWGANETEGSVVMPKTLRADHLRATSRWSYAAVDTTADRRLIRVDRSTGAVGIGATSMRYAESFPGGEKAGATYRGRIVGADDEGAFWLVEETLPGASTPARAVLISVPDQGAASVVLENITAPSAFFVADDAFYWQEGDALLTAPRSGGAASIAAHLPGTAGALADGFVYYVTGDSIERLAL